MTALAFMLAAAVLLPGVAYLAAANAVRTWRTRYGSIATAYACAACVKAAALAEGGPI